MYIAVRVLVGIIKFGIHVHRDEVVKHKKCNYSTSCRKIENIRRFKVALLLNFKKEIIKEPFKHDKH